MFATVTRPRRGGKSRILASIARKNPRAIIVTLSRIASRDFIEQHHVPEAQVMTFSELQDGRLRGHTAVGPILFDNFEYMLPALLGEVGVFGADFIISATGTNL